MSAARRILRAWICDPLVESIVIVLCCRLDDKLFSFWVLQGESFPFALVKGVFRFETGIKVTEFRDLRANPRCVFDLSERILIST